MLQQTQCALHAWLRVTPMLVNAQCWFVSLQQTAVDGVFAEEWVKLIVDVVSWGD